ncbi:MAG TPA: class I SAM-dependent methyltransferase [Conexibacter sp.]|nr:class I SAM-dependent methyltransferase [Conexibacter sp.]
MSDEDHEPHSAAFFGRWRDFWWNVDHLELIASRRALGDVRSVLDVGAGVGHWGTLLASVLSPDASIVGIDREPQWIQEATRRAERLGLGHRCQYQHGAAESLPFDDATFDLVTCQTLLMHVADPSAVIREMLRVTRPGGQVIAAEPNNRAWFLVASSVTAGAEIEDTVDLMRFYLTCERGKIALGEGNLSIGDLLPSHFMDEGLSDVEAFVSDKAAVMLPPYASEEQQARKQHFRETAQRGIWGLSRDQVRRFYTAGGGAETEFDASWQRRAAEMHAVANALDTGDFRTAGGNIIYLVAGTRPSE